MRIAWRWRFGGKGRRHGLPSRLIVSVTSYPPRFGVLATALRGLLRQTVQADETVLWIAHKDMALLPKEVTDLQAEGLTIRATEDLRSYKKIVPALDTSPEAFLCTADDDVYYWSTWLEELVDEIRGDSLVVACHRAHEVALDAEGRYGPYAKWKLDASFRGESGNLFPTGIGGVLYSPGTLRHSAEDRRSIELASNNDDIWLYWMGRRNGARYRTAGRHRDLITLKGSQAEALWHGNLSEGRNDGMIRATAERYGYPPIPSRGPLMKESLGGTR